MLGWLLRNSNIKVIDMQHILRVKLFTNLDNFLHWHEFTKFCGWHFNTLPCTIAQFYHDCNIAKQFTSYHYNGCHPRNIISLSSPPLFPPAFFYGFMFICNAECLFTRTSIFTFMGFFFFGFFSLLIDSFSVWNMFERSCIFCVWNLKK